MFRQILSSGEGTMYLAERQGIPAGLLYRLSEEESARIEALLTVPEVWGKGVAAGLMKQALSDTIDFSAVTVWPFAENHRARRFYEKHGFHPTGQTRTGDAVEMEYCFKFE
jgi:RimJ/RimL family protein N-acetyltransferase